MKQRGLVDSRRVEAEARSIMHHRVRTGRWDRYSDDYYRQAWDEAVERELARAVAQELDQEE